MVLLNFAHNNYTRNVTLTFVEISYNKNIFGSIFVLSQKDPPEDYYNKKIPKLLISNPNSLCNPHATNIPNVQDTLKGPYNNNLTDSFFLCLCIAMFLTTSPIDINVPTRGFLAVETMHAIVQWLANLNIKGNMTSIFVNKKHRCISTCEVLYYLYSSSERVPHPCPPRR